MIFPIILLTLSVFQNHEDQVTDTKNHMSTCVDAVSKFELSRPFSDPTCRDRHLAFS